MRTLTVGMMQSNYDLIYSENIKRIRKDADALMKQMNPPELIIGIEFGLGDHHEDNTVDTIPGYVTGELSKIAKEYRVYLAAGSMLEKKIVDGKEKKYNALPIFNPQGELVQVYRKICPYYPAEEGTDKGEEYCVLEIPEKKAKIGFMICHDWCFPEISRNLTYLGAEMLIRIAFDPEGLQENCRHIAEVRAFENQAFFISLNTAGTQNGIHSYGETCIAAPDGKEIHAAGQGELNFCTTFDLDDVTRTRTYGTNFTDQLVRQLKEFSFPELPCGDRKNGPVFDNLPDPDLTMKQRKERFMEAGIISEFK